MKRKKQKKTFSNNFKRFSAFVIDITIINYLIMMIVKVIPEFQIPQNEFAVIGTFFIFLVLFVSIQVIYNVGMYYYFNGTLGKKLLGVDIVDRKKRKVKTSVMIKREYYKWSLFYGTFGLYSFYLAIMLLSNKSAIHETAYDTYFRKEI